MTFFHILLRFLFCFFSCPSRPLHLIFASNKVSHIFFPKLNSHPYWYSHLFIYFQFEVHAIPSSSLSNLFLIFNNSTCFISKSISFYFCTQKTFHNILLYFFIVIQARLISIFSSSINPSTIYLFRHSITNSFSLSVSYLVISPSFFFHLSVNCIVNTILRDGHLDIFKQLEAIIIKILQFCTPVDA